MKRCRFNQIAYSCNVLSDLSPPSGGYGRLHNGGSAVLLPFKYHSALIFGFMSGYYVLTCHVLHRGWAKKNGTALSLITQAWHRDGIAPATRHGDAGPLQSHRLFEKFNYTLKGTGNACGQNGAQSRSHPSQWQCVTFPWILNWVCYSRQAVLVTVICMFNPPSPFLLLLLPPTPLPFGLCFSHCRTCLYLCGWEPSLARPCSNMYSYQRGKEIEKRTPSLHPFNVYPQPTKNFYCDALSAMERYHCCYGNYIYTLRHALPQFDKSNKY